jgi:Flp pilus assembly protein TadD
MDATKRHKQRQSCLQALLRLLCFFVASSAFAQEAPKTANEYFEAGVAAQRSGDLQSAIDAYKHAVTVEPTNASAHYNLGITLQKVGNHKDALVALKRATELKGDYAEAFVYLGKSYEYL